MRTCISCNVSPSRYGRRCQPCTADHIQYMEFGRGKREAGSAVAKAKRKGLLRPASEFSCTDCSAPAVDYDHRDYNKPLEVQPVCRSCNLRRGSAIPRVPPELAEKHPDLVPVDRATA